MKFMKNTDEKDFKPIGILLLIIILLIFVIATDIAVGDKRSVFKIIMDIFTFRHKISKPISAIYLVIIIFIYGYIIRPIVKNYFPKSDKILIRMENYYATHLKPKKSEKGKKKKNNAD